MIARQECNFNIPTSTPTTMNDRHPPLGSKLDPASATHHWAPPSVITSRPDTHGGLGGQSSVGHPAQPLSPPQRTIDDPFPQPTPLQHQTPTRATICDTDRSLRLVKGGGEDRESLLSGTEAGDKVKKGQTHKQNINVYTQYGRHTNDWLFGGFSVSDTVKKLWHKGKE